jgi:hypothetical protein
MHAHVTRTLLRCVRCRAYQVARVVEAEDVGGLRVSVRTISIAGRVAV